MKTLVNKTKHLRNTPSFIFQNIHFHFPYVLSFFLRTQDDKFIRPKEREEFTSFLNHTINTKATRTKYILESNLDIINTVEDMCKLTRLSTKALRKEMINIYGKNPKIWLDKQRLSKAVFLLKSTQKSVSQISTSCGYSSPSWFIIQFKKYYKITPLLFRQKLVNKYK